MHKVLYILTYCALFSMMPLASCAPSLPDGVLDSDEMEDILYDMHIAQALYETGEVHSTESDIITLRANVLKKHGLTQQEWDFSMEYYCQHAEELHKIYANMANRVERNVIALGGKNAGVQGEEADTANVWDTNANIILMQQSPYNIMSYDITPDSTFHDGDKISLQCDTKFIFQDGYKALALVMAVTYDNDSIATVVTHLNNDGHGILTLNNEKDRLHVNNIKGFIMLERNPEAVTTKQTSTTIRMVSLRNIKLLHFHTAPPVPPVVEPVDSMKADSTQNALQET